MHSIRFRIKRFIFKITLFFQENKFRLYPLLTLSLFSGLFPQKSSLDLKKGLLDSIPRRIFQNLLNLYSPKFQDVKFEL